MSKLLQTVITSYSIHYTKLYESSSIINTFFTLFYTLILWIESKILASQHGADVSFEDITNLADNLKSQDKASNEQIIN